METDIVYRNESGVAVTTSYLVAEVFGKNHKRVLEDIDRLNCSDSFRKPNFGLSLKLRELPNGGHKEERYYIITRDGFTILAMGYTGKKAMEFKEKYIAAFNAMEHQLKQGIAHSLESLSRKQILQMALEAEEEKERMAARLALAESRNTELQASVDSILPRIEQLERRMAEPVESVATEIIVKEGDSTGEIGHLTVYQRAHSHDKGKLRAMFPSYVTLTEALERIRKKGIYVNKADLFKYLRTNGYLSSNPYTYNCPEEHCMRKGWMLTAYGGAFNDRPKVKRMYVPYLSPAFVTVLEQLLREHLKKNKENENNLFNQKEIIK